MAKRADRFTWHEGDVRILRAVGEVGLRLALTVTVEDVSEYQTYQGETRLRHRLRDAEGNAFLWETWPANALVEAGKRYRLLATVKGYQAWQGAPLTVLRNVANVTLLPQEGERRSLRERLMDD